MVNWTLTTIIPGCGEPNNVDLNFGILFSSTVFFFHKQYIIPVFANQFGIINPEDEKKILEGRGETWYGYPQQKNSQFSRDTTCALTANRNLSYAELSRQRFAPLLFFFGAYLETSPQL